MYLTQLAADVISKNVRCKNRLALELDCSVDTVERWLSENKVNNDLTKVTALKVINEETGLSQNDVLSERKPVEA